MTHVVAGKLRKATFIKDGCGPDGMSKMYGIELAEVVKDYKTGEKSYTNYKALFFAKTPNAQSYYDQALVEGSYVVVSCDKIKIERREYNGQTYTTLTMENPRLDGANYPEKGQQQQQQQQQQGGYSRPQQQPQSAPPVYSEPPMDFNDDIPFAPIGLQYQAILNCM